MTTDQMRAVVLERYPGDGWAKKVNKMSDAQIFAIYNKINDKKK